jgi:hypothetical protein
LLERCEMYARLWGGQQTDFIKTARRAPRAAGAHAHV